MRFLDRLFGKRVEPDRVAERLRHVLFQRDCVEALFGAVAIRGLPRNQEQAAIDKVVEAAFAWAADRLEEISAHGDGWRRP